MLAPVSLKLDCDKLVPRLWDRFLSVFEKDAKTQSLKAWIEERTSIAVNQATFVQCMGMHRPVRLSEIYQPTRLKGTQSETFRSPSEGRAWSSFQHDELSLTDFLGKKSSAIVTAGPGWGKTTLLNHLFLRNLAQDSYADSAPFLFTLRDADAIDHLEHLIVNLEALRKKADKNILLLVDGYDEVSAESRRKVSQLLNKFAARKWGYYYLTCREHYPIFDLKAPYYRVADFSEEDQANFARTFFKRTSHKPTPSNL